MAIVIYGVKLPNHLRANAYALYGSRRFRYYRLVHRSGREAVSTSLRDLKDLGLLVRLPSGKLIREMRPEERSIVGDAKGNVWLSENTMGVDVVGTSAPDEFSWKRI